MRPCCNQRAARSASQPTFVEDMPSVEQRTRKLVAQVRCKHAFERAHPLVVKLLAHDDERRKESIMTCAAALARARRPWTALNAGDRALANVRLS